MHKTECCPEAIQIESHAVIHLVHGRKEYER